MTDTDAKVAALEARLRGEGWLKTYDPGEGWQVGKGEFWRPALSLDKGDDLLEWVELAHIELLWHKSSLEWSAEPVPDDPKFPTYAHFAKKPREAIRAAVRALAEAGE